MTQPHWRITDMQEQHDLSEHSFQSAFVSSASWIIYLIWSCRFSTSQICDMKYRIQSKWARAEVRIVLMELYGQSLSSHVIYHVKSSSSWATVKVQVIHWFEKVRNQKSVVSHLKCFLNLISGIYYLSLPLTPMDGFPSPLINMFLHNGAYKSVTSGTTGYQ